MSQFKEKVYFVVKKIPRGKVATYKQVARLAGNPKAYRAVGTAMRHNPDMKTVPCHRVVGSDGTMHGYSGLGGLKKKIEKLKNEGVVMNKNRAILKISQWRP